MRNRIENESYEFSKLRGDDIRELLTYILKNKLKYRESLNISSDVTFGVEIEYENLKRGKVDKFIEKFFPAWCSKDDGSLDSGGEISSSVMIDDIIFWKELSAICNYLRKKKVDTSMNSGGHIHVGTSILGDDIDAWRRFLKLYSAYENVIFRFALGDKINERPSQNIYARNMYNVLPYYISKLAGVKDTSTLSKCLPLDSKNYAVNFKNVCFSCLNSNNYGNTIEFRSPNGTVDEVIWQNNINFFVKMLLSVKKDIDEEYLIYRIHNRIFDYDEDNISFGRVNLEDALEFVDIVFDNNLDKIYFLTQYLKKYQMNYGYTKAVQAKRFTKK